MLQKGDPLAQQPDQPVFRVFVNRNLVTDLLGLAGVLEGAQVVLPVGVARGQARDHERQRVAAQTERKERYHERNH